MILIRNISASHKMPFVSIHYVEVNISKLGKSVIYLLEGVSNKKIVKGKNIKPWPEFSRHGFKK